jgi:hypothetical protein
VSGPLLAVVLACLAAAAGLAACEWGRLVGRGGRWLIARAAQLRNARWFFRSPLLGDRSPSAVKRPRRAVGHGPRQYRSSQGRLLSSPPPAGGTAELGSAGRAVDLLDPANDRYWGDP